MFTDSPQRQQVRRALDQLKPYLAAFVAQHLPPQSGVASDIGVEPDVQRLLRDILGAWPNVFSRLLPRQARNYFHELADIRNRWAHEQPFNEVDTRRALDTVVLVARAIGAPEPSIDLRQAAHNRGSSAEVSPVGKWITDPAILFRISRSYREGMSKEALYEACRGVWRISDMRERARFAMPVANNCILEVYEIERWTPAGTTEYTSRRFGPDDLAGRWEFVGRLAGEEIRRRYVGKAVEAYFPQGAMNPVAYAMD